MLLSHPVVSLFSIFVCFSDMLLLCHSVDFFSPFSFCSRTCYCVILSFFCCPFRCCIFQLDRQELQAALLLYMKSLARVIPTVVAHELEDMGRLIDLDSEQVQEEIVSVVDEVSPSSCVPAALKAVFLV